MEGKPGSTHEEEHGTIQPYQREFIEFALSQEVLRFGTFQLKSGRQSPYFFNAGGCHEVILWLQISLAVYRALCRGEVVRHADKCSMT